MNTSVPVRPGSTILRTGQKSSFLQAARGPASAGMAATGPGGPLPAADPEKFDTGTLTFGDPRPAGDRQLASDRGIGYPHGRRHLVCPAWTTR